MAVQTTAPSRPDPVWFTPEAVEACEDAWSLLDDRPTESARARRRRRRIQSWVALGIALGFVLVVLVWDWMGRDATGTPFRSFLPFPVTVALFLVGFGLNLAGLIINTRDPGSWASRRPAGDATVAIAGAWRRRLEQALRSHEPLPTPWLRVVDGVAEQRGRPVGHVLRSVGWPVVLTVNAAQLGDPSYVLVMMGVSVWCVVDGVRDAVRAHRVRRYLGWLREHPVG